MVNSNEICGKFVSRVQCLKNVDTIFKRRHCLILYLNPFSVDPINVKYLVWNRSFSTGDEYPVLERVELNADHRLRSTLKRERSSF